MGFGIPCARRPLARSGGSTLESPQPWGIVLAGGDGRRLRAYVRSAVGDDRPKQYAAVVGSRSLLTQTLERAALEIPISRTVVVARADHASFLAEEFSRPGGPWIIGQPLDRGTLAGVLLPVHWVLRREPSATVVILPSDHFVLEEREFMAHVVGVARYAVRHPERIVILGARPTDLDTDYGWIKPGRSLDESDGRTILEVRRFWEKPSPDDVGRGVPADALWNTFVIVGRASSLVALGRRLAPRTHAELAWASRLLGTSDEEWALDQAYAHLPNGDFSRAILEHATSRLAVSPLPSLTWTDLGTAPRLERLLSKLALFRRLA